MSEPTLVERLRHNKRHGVDHMKDCLEAADRIDELEAEAGMLNSDALLLCETDVTKLRATIATESDEITRLNAVYDKLAAEVRHNIQEHYETCESEGLDTTGFPEWCYE